MTITWLRSSGGVELKGSYTSKYSLPPAKIGEGGLVLEKGCEGPPE